MGLLNQLAAAATHAAQQTADTDAAPSLMSLAQPLLAHFGGVQGLLTQLQNGGLADAVQSWLGQGANQEISGDQLQAALGGGVMDQLAQQTGQPVAQLSEQLAQMLPAVVDQLSPQGMLSQAGLPDLSALGGMLGGFLKS